MKSIPLDIRSGEFTTSLYCHLHYLGVSVILSLAQLCTLFGWMTLPMRVKRTLFSKSLRLRDCTIRSRRGIHDPACFVICGHWTTTSETWQNLWGYIMAAVVCMENSLCSSMWGNERAKQHSEILITVKVSNWFSQLYLPNTLANMCL